MKKIINHILITSLCIGAVVGCTREKTVEYTSGEKASVEMVLQFPMNTPSESATRATNDTNGTAAEAAVNTVDVFIYTGGGDYWGHQHLAGSAFTQQPSTATADVWQANTTFVAQTGANNFYIGVNLPTAIATALEHKSMSAAANLAHTIARADITTLPAGGIPMFSTSAVAATLQPRPTTNTITADVKRIVAKVTVEKATNMRQDGTSGQLGQMSWTINNQNSRVFMLQGGPSAYADPNWTAASYNSTDFHDAATPAVAAEWPNVNNGPVTDVSTYNVLYALENTSDQKTMKELTRVTVRATFVPEKWIDTGGYNSTTGTLSDPVNNTNYNASPGASTPTDFWTVAPGAGQDTQYFRSQTDADAYAQSKSVTASAHTGGWCYWNIFLNKANRGDVYRNDFYKCNITRVVAPGQNTPALKDPNSQPTQDTDVTAVVNVLHWNTPVQDNYELVP